MPNESQVLVIKHRVRKLQDTCVSESSSLKVFPVQIHYFFIHQSCTVIRRSVTVQSGDFKPYLNCRWNQCSLFPGAPSDLFLSNNCSKEHILPRNFYSLRKAKNFWITVPFVLNFERFSGSLTTIFGGCVIHILIPRYCDNCQEKSPTNFGIKTKCPI